jgi:hypothetical protein
VEVVAPLSQGRTAAAQCGLFTHKSVPVIYEPPCILAQAEVCWAQTSSDFREEFLKLSGIHLEDMENAG